MNIRIECKSKDLQAEITKAYEKANNDRTRTVTKHGYPDAQGKFIKCTRPMMREGKWGELGCAWCGWVELHSWER